MKCNVMYIILIFLLISCSLQISFAQENYKTTDSFGELISKDYGEFKMDTPSKIKFNEGNGSYDSHIFITKS